MLAPPGGVSQFRRVWLIQTMFRQLAVDCVNIFCSELRPGHGTQATLVALADDLFQDLKEGMSLPSPY